MFNLSFAHEVATIGEAIVDHYLFIEDTFLTSISGRKGGTEQVNSATFSRILKQSCQHPQKNAGGSGLNMIKGLARLGHDCGAMGYIGTDENGNFFQESLRKNGVHCYFSEIDSPTASCLCLITPDCQRTMRTNLGDMGKPVAVQKWAPVFDGLKHFHLEGYQIYKKQMVQEAFSLAKNQGASVSLDLGSFEFVRLFKQDFLDVIQAGAINILFANHEEAKALTDLPPKDAALHLAKFCDIAVVTMSNKGGYVASNGEVFRYKAYQANPRDETGAGDFFISGFLHGYLTNRSLEESAAIGAKLAAHIVENIGTELPDETWQSVHEYFSQTLISR